MLNLWRNLPSFLQEEYMKRLYIFILSVLASFAVLHISVFASFEFLHSGKTDSYGGHYNSSTGEYHYHHGYSAHDHYDINGDGTIDCPYNFKDNTIHNNSNSNKAKDEVSNKNKNETNNTADKPEVNYENQKSKVELIGVLKIAILTIIFLSYPVVCIVEAAINLIERLHMKATKKELKISKPIYIVAYIVFIVSIILFLIYLRFYY
jgi:hypothetical protein